jgi:hypothetical protein
MYELVVLRAAPDPSVAGHVPFIRHKPLLLIYAAQIIAESAWLASLTATILSDPFLIEVVDVIPTTAVTEVVRPNVWNE